MKQWSTDYKVFYDNIFYGQTMECTGDIDQIYDHFLHNLLYIRLKWIKRAKIKKNYWTNSCCCWCYFFYCPVHSNRLFVYKFVSCFLFLSFGQSFIFQSTVGQDVDFINSHVCGTNSTMIYPIRPRDSLKRTRTTESRISLVWNESRLSLSLQLSVRFDSDALHAGLVHITSDYTVTNLLKNAKLQ